MVEKKKKIRIEPIRHVLKSDTVPVAEPVEYDEDGKPIIPPGYVRTYHRRKGLMKLRVSSSNREV